MEVHKHESVFDQNGLNMMTFIEKCSELQLNQFDPIKVQAKGQARTFDSLEFPRGSCESLRRPKTIAQNCQMGPIKQHKMCRNSNVIVEISGQDESRATAKFTNQSISHLEGQDIEEFTQEANEEPGVSDMDTIEKSHGPIMISEGRQRIEEAAGRT